MKTIEEVNENINGSKVKLQENYQNEVKFASVLTPAVRANYAKTRAYISGWIDCLENKRKEQSGNSEYEAGYTNADKWRQSE